MDREVIYVSGISPKMKGLKIGEYELKIADNDKMFVSAQGLFYKYFGTGVDYKLKNHIGYAYFERSVEPTSPLYTTKSLIHALRLYKTSKIGFFCPLTINEKGGYVVMPDNMHTYHSINEYLPEFYLNELEIKEINELFCNIDEKKKVILKDISRMNEIFIDSYRIHSIDTKFILRMIIPEMCINSNQELNYRICRSVAIFLGKTEDESREIFTKMSTLYSARSGFVHNGEKVLDNKKVCKDKNTDYIFFITDIARRIIANLYVMNKEPKEVFDILTEFGYGDNPYKVNY